ncbi:hypothetical protein L5515_004178 [Caenorhabditis briggsae]|uniref:Uncharacterized protein n=1 Tax=Caenorhabditis briggsae TaxID=6238 RepID=A0AAE9DCB3_CAEBR|nr:hypothetical protein L3Y34_001319 [Caenorhabditis briggsae]UMM23477.1 hypothetical protein L5515_004178 [Caenorhabditis briggsae]
MRRLLGFILIFSVQWVVEGASSSCKSIVCPKQTGKTIPCDMCHDCLNSGSRFCYTSDHKNCQCATIVPPSCGSGAVNYTFCHLLDDVVLPPPEIVVHDEHSVSAVVPRFFQEAPFDVIKPSFLYLLALFTKNGSECTSFGHIEAYHRQQDRCLLRIRVQMPKIDYTGTDNYYYDDRSALESQFSRDLFGIAENVTFWNEVTIRRDEKILNGTLAFATVMKSTRVDYSL